MMTDWWCVPRQKKKEDLFTVVEAHPAIDGNTRYRRRCHRGGVGETGDELVEPAHRNAGGNFGVRQRCHLLSVLLSLSMTLFRRCDKIPGRKGRWCSATR